MYLEDMIFILVCAAVVLLAIALYLKARELKNLEAQLEKAQKTDKTHQENLGGRLDGDRKYQKELQLFLQIHDLWDEFQKSESYILHIIDTCSDDDERLTLIKKKMKEEEN